MATAKLKYLMIQSGHEREAINYTLERQKSENDVELKKGGSPLL